MVRGERAVALNLDSLTLVASSRRYSHRAAEPGPRQTRHLGEDIGVDLEPVRVTLKGSSGDAPQPRVIEAPPGSPDRTRSRAAFRARQLAVKQRQKLIARA